MDHAPALKALADPARLQIVAFLHRPKASNCTFADRVCACDLEGLLGLSQPAVSHHMRLLVAAGLVQAEKSGRWMYYSLDPDAFGDLIEFLSPYSLPPRKAAA
jgi:ArsR family transcriptional regulator